MAIIGTPLREKLMADKIYLLAQGHKSVLLPTIQIQNMMDWRSTYPGKYDIALNKSSLEEQFIPSFEQILLMQGITKEDISEVVDLLFHKQGLNEWHGRRVRENGSIISVDGPYSNSPGYRSECNWKVIDYTDNPYGLKSLLSRRCQ